MHKTARQRYVLDILSEQGQASITDLAEKLQVSADTIRRDLTDLENQGLAQKNHGGAIALNLSAMNRQGRNTLLPETKQRLGKQVAQQVPPGSTLFLDAGSTVMAVATCWVWISCSAMSALASLEAVFRCTARSCRERVASSTRPRTVRILACNSLMWKSAMALASSPE